jgi:hypothetical protein
MLGVYLKWLPSGTMGDMPNPGDGSMLIHIITLCMGLIIAYGLGQIFEIFQRRRRLREARAAELAARKPHE